MLKKCLDLEPNHAALAAFGENFRSQGRLEEKAEVLEMSLAVNLASAFALAAYGNILRQQGRYEEAAEQLERCLSIDLDNAFALEVYKVLDALEWLQDYSVHLSHFIWSLN